MCRFPFCFIQQLLCVESFQVQTLQEKGLKSKKITKHDHSKDLTDKTNIYVFSARIQISRILNSLYSQYRLLPVLGLTVIRIWGARPL